jgi:hypothetical protein
VQALFRQHSCRCAICRTVLPLVPSLPRNLLLPPNPEPPTPHTVVAKGSTCHRGLSKLRRRHCRCDKVLRCVACLSRKQRPCLPHISAANCSNSLAHTMPSWPTALAGMFSAGYVATQAQKVGLDSMLTSVTKVFAPDGSSASFSGRTGSTGEVSACCKHRATPLSCTMHPPLGRALSAPCNSPQGVPGRCVRD